MRSQRWYHWTLRTIYYYSLWSGLLPAPLDWGALVFRKSHLYLVYSALGHCVCLATMLISSYYFFDHGYMSGHPVLQWMYTITNATKVVAIVLLIKESWCKRQLIIATFEEFCSMERRYGNLQTKLDPCGRYPLCEQYTVQQRIELFLIFKVFNCLSSTLMINGIFMRIHPGDGQAYLYMTFFSFVVSVTLAVAMCLFFFALCQLYRQFAGVNADLCVVVGQLKSLKPAVGGLTADREKLQLLTARLASLGAKHFDCYRLALRIFRISETACVAIVARMFATNVRIIYHAVLFVSFHLTPGAWTVATELLLTILFYCDSALIMWALEAVLSSCNDTSQLLRECSEFVEQTNDSAHLTRAVDSFCNHLRCHKLVYKICGLFEFNKEASLRYFLTVLVKVTVLVQFDMIYNSK